MRVSAVTADDSLQDTRERLAATNVRLRGPLLRVAREIQDMLEVRMSSAEVMVGMQRIDIPLLSTLTRRECVANALVHRDCSALGPITVQLIDTEFSVTSPGGFRPE